jgi:hypothetical protein
MPSKDVIAGCIVERARRCGLATCVADLALTSLGPRPSRLSLTSSGVLNWKS